MVVFTAGLVGGCGGGKGGTADGAVRDGAAAESAADRAGSGGDAAAADTRDVGADGRGAATDGPDAAADGSTSPSDGRDAAAEVPDAAAVSDARDAAAPDVRPDAVSDGGADAVAADVRPDAAASDVRTDAGTDTAASADAAADAAPSGPRLTVITAGTGTVTSDPAGISCGAACAAGFTAGAVVTLQARTTNGSGYFFSGWTGGGCSGPSRTCRVTLSASTIVTATFSPMTNNLVFVSSGAFPTNRGSAAAYDADCNAAATAAGINTAGMNGYVAATADAATTVAGRLGATARGWVRMDGKPFKDLFATATSQDPVMNTIRYTEVGEAQQEIIPVMSGLPIAGATYNCRNFTSTSANDTVASGLTEGGPGRWILGSEGGTYLLCSDGPFRIVCLGKTKTAAIPAVAPAGKLVWTSAGTYQPQSLTPDQVCQAQRPPGVTTAAALVDYSNRSHAALLSATASYYRVDGTLVGTGAVIGNLTDNLQSGIWQDAAGNYLTRVGGDVVTGGGMPPFAGTCGDWTATTGMASGGDISDPRGESWWRSLNMPCGTPGLHFYCVQTAP